MNATKVIGWSLLTVDYCPEHVPTSRLAETQKQPIYQRDDGPKIQCHVCNGRLA